jgi:hypothetical protein
MKTPDAVFAHFEAMYGLPRLAKEVMRFGTGTPFNADDVMPQMFEKMRKIIGGIYAQQLCISMVNSACVELVARKDIS